MMPPFKFVCPTNKIAHFVEVSLYFILSSTTSNFSFFELSLPDDDPVYTLKKVMEELDFSGLLANCSDKGRTGYNPIMMYAVVTYAICVEYVLLTVLLICVKETLLLSG